jgi:hypothetical protein
MRAQMIGLGVILLAAVQGCSSGPTATDEEVEPGEPAGEVDCSALITPTAVDALGWPASEPVEHAGRCLLRTDRGEVTVGTRPVPADDQERADAVQEEFEAQCDRLRADGPHFVGAPAWLPEGEEGCLTQVDPQTGTGVAELIVLNREGEVVQIRVAAATRAGEDAVDTALEELALATADLCDAECA